MILAGERPFRSTLCNDYVSWIYSPRGYTLIHVESQFQRYLEDDRNHSDRDCVCELKQPGARYSMKSTGHRFVTFN